MPKNKDLPKPVTYSQQFYAKAAGMGVDLPEAITPEQKYLKAIAERGESIGNIGDVEIDNPENGEVMKYDAEQGKWINGTASGGGGTSDYTDLTNKPKINNVTLAGNKALSDIGAAAAAETYTDAEVDTLLAGKVDKVDGKGLSTEDFTTAEKTKLAGIAAGAEVNVQANWAQTSSSADDFIKNKPTLGAAASKGVDSAPTASSTNLVTSGGVATALAAKLNTADVDDALSSTSTNPVQNKAVQAPVARLVDAGSKNIADMSKTSFTSQTKGGVTVTLSGDTFTSSGTSTSDINNFFNVFYVDLSTVLIPSGKWVTVLEGTGIENFKIEEFDSYNGMTLKGEFGKPFHFEIHAGVTVSYLRITTKPNTLCDGNFRLMICKEEDYAISTDFVPYAKSNYELTQDVKPIPRLVNAGAKNIFDISTLKSSGSLASGSFTNNGVTYTLNSDGTISLSGTATSNSTCSFVLFNANSPHLAKFAGKDLSGGLSARVYLAIEMSSSPYTLLALSQNGAGKIGVPDSTKQYLFYIRVMSGENVNGKIISPMICTEEDYAISPEFVPYAPSNRELYKMILALQNAQNGG